MKNILPSFVCGFAAAVLTTIPGLKEFGCCFVIPLAGGFSLFLDLKINNSSLPIQVKKAIWFGFLTGIFAALFSTGFDILLTAISRTNDFVETLPQSEQIIQDMNLGDLAEESLNLMKGVANEIKQTGFSVFYSVIILFSNLIIDIIFAILGAVIAKIFLNKKAERI
ncbi:MAG: DUF4199 domain-containing protein [Ignavibacteriales bacterium]|nr:DUF4199 domain-containing protein [Ignavibacteriales bacterium]